MSKDKKQFTHKIIKVHPLESHRYLCVSVFALVIFLIQINIFFHIIINFELCVITGTILMMKISKKRIVHFNKTIIKI